MECMFSEAAFRMFLILEQVSMGRMSTGRSCQVS